MVATERWMDGLRCVAYLCELVFLGLRGTSSQMEAEHATAREPRPLGPKNHSKYASRQSNMALVPAVVYLAPRWRAWWWTGA
jgi:hypothetical protein